MKEQLAQLKQQLPQNRSFWFGLLFFVVVLIAMTTGGFKLLHHVEEEKGAPVSVLLIHGDMQYSTSYEIQQALTQVDMTNFFALDVNEVQKHVESLAWVETVTVRKQWPSTLRLYVVDQKPVAYWNGDFLLNEKGQAFQADMARINSDLPHFFGPEGAEITALENYRNFNSLLEYVELNISELVLSERFAWQLTLSDGVMLNLGREERIERIQRFMDSYAVIKQYENEKQAVQYIDLRYDTGLAVGWKTKTEQVKV